MYQRINIYQDVKKLEDLQFDRFIGKISKDGPASSFLNEDDLTVPTMSTTDEENIVENNNYHALKLKI